MPGTERYTEGLNECTNPAAADWMQIADMSESADRDRKVSASLIPWTNSVSTFTQPVIVAPAAVSGLYCFSANLPAGAATNQRAFRWQFDGALRGYINTFVNENSFVLSAFDNGASIGCFVSVQRNSNATTPAAGLLYMQPKTASTRRIWVDDAGQLRIHTADPTNANDTAGVVVGTQTSSLEAKRLTGPAPSAAEALQHIAAGAAAVRAFIYKEGHNNNEEFSGMIVDYAPRYGMDRDEEHPAGKSLNVINALGDLMIAVADLAQRIAALEPAQPAAG